MQLSLCGPPTPLTLRPACETFLGRPLGLLPRHGCPHPAWISDRTRVWYRRGAPQVAKLGGSMFEGREGALPAEEGDPLAEIRSQIRQRLTTIWGLMRTGLCSETERDVLEWIQDRCDRAARKSEATPDQQPGTCGTPWAWHSLTVRADLPCRSWSGQALGKGSPVARKNSAPTWKMALRSRRCSWADPRAPHPQTNPRANRYAPWEVAEAFQLEHKVSESPCWCSNRSWS